MYEDTQPISFTFEQAAVIVAGLIGVEERVDAGKTANDYFGDKSIRVLIAEVRDKLMAAAPGSVNVDDVVPD